MNSLSTLIGGGEPLSTASSFLRFCRDQLRQHGDLLEKIQITALSALAVVAHMYPPLLPYVALGWSYSSYSSLLSSHFWIVVIGRHLSIAKLYATQKQWPPFFYTACKMFSAAATLFFIPFSLSMNLFLVAGKLHFVRNCYQTLRPISLMMTLIEIIQWPIDYFRSKEVSLSFNEPLLSELRELQQGATTSSSQSLLLYDLLFYDFLNDQAIANIEAAGGLRVVLAHRFTVDRLTILVRSIGSISMVICNSYRETLLEKSIRFANSLLDTGLCCYSKWGISLYSLNQDRIE